MLVGNHYFRTDIKFELLQYYFIRLESFWCTRHFRMLLIDYLIIPQFNLEHGLCMNNCLDYFQ
jgi:hypothetical protein